VRRLVILCGVAVLAAACAVMEPPSGGPEDRTPPRVLSTAPPADSAGVSPGVRPVITFSERMDEESFKNRVMVFPPLPFDRLKVRGESLEISFDTLFPADTTVCIVLRPGFRDNHLVSSPLGYTFYFATADSMAGGQISGSILFKEKPDSTGVAELFELRGDTAFAVDRTKPSRAVNAEALGRFAFRGLPAGNAQYVLRAFTDRDGDGHYSPSKEFAALYPDTIVLTPAAPVRENVTVRVIDPNEPGSIAGRVVNETALGRPATLRLEPFAKGVRVKTAEADTTGSFLLAPVQPGMYRLSAFIDMKPDTLCGSYVEAADTTKTLSEPCVTIADTLVVKPGEAKTIPAVTLK